MERIRADGKFLRVGDRRTFLRMVTYGPFPGGWADDFTADFARISAAGFDSLRLYEWPTPELLDRALDAGLRVFAGLKWDHARDFFRGDGPADAHAALASGLAVSSIHPALAGVFVANEVPADLARWMGPARVRRTLEELIAAGRAAAPGLLWCYANYPGTEYLEPGNADLTAMNVYLEHEDDFRAYLKRLHHIAGDRPLLVSEFGLDSRRNGLSAQAETLSWALRACRDAGTAGMAVYAWSDRWWNAGAEVPDWDFGLTDREGRAKPALEAVSRSFAEATERREGPRYSVVVCTRNGIDRIGRCLEAVARLRHAEFETVVVDDGSEDGTAELVARDHPDVKLVRLDHGGLSAARNAGATAAEGEFLAFTDDDCEPDPEWLSEMSACLASGVEAAGGPNLPPPPENLSEAVVMSAPGAASHVMLDDSLAEHVPGCNLVVRRTTYFGIGGFDPAFRTAGDDVDFCWRLRDAGCRIGFAPTGFVWHHRRPTIAGYLRQQLGYGRAEAMLMRKHPRRFSPSGDAIWHGTIYGGTPVRATEGAVIYHGPMGLAGYQGVVDRVQPLRDPDPRFDGPVCRLLLRIVGSLGPRVRSWARIRRFRGPLRPDRPPPAAPSAEFALWTGEDREQVLRSLIGEGWQSGGSTDGWDLEKGGTRLLVATEKADGGGRRTLVRVWGDHSGIPLLRNARRLR